MMAGTAGGQAVAALSSPLLSRMFSPEDFGVFAIVSAVGLTIGSAGALRFDAAIPLPRQEEDAYSLATLGLGATAFVASMATSLLMLGGDRLAAILSLDNPDYLFAVPLLILSLGFYLVLNQLAIRHRRYGAASRRYLVQSVLTVIAQVALRFIGLRAWAILLGYALGQLAGAATLLKGSGVLSSEARTGHDSARLRRVLSRYRRFPVLLAPSTMLNTAGLQLPVVALASLYGAQASGWMGMTQRVLAVPVTLIGTSLAQVYLGELARSVRTNDGQALGLFKQASKRLAAAAAILIVGLLLLSPWGFSAVLGSAWYGSGEYARALALGVGLQLVAAPLGPTLTVLERQKQQLAWDFSRLAGGVGSVFAAHLAGLDSLGAVWTLGIVMAAMYVAYWLLSFRALNKHHRNGAGRRSDSTE